MLDMEDEIHLGRTYPNFPPQLALTKSCFEQIEDEGGSEEVEAQLSNNGWNRNIKYQTYKAKGSIQNYFIDRKNTQPSWNN
ncbi:MAG: hypothetical protein EZS28_006362 [Streblomastix strix]|uniref:Uncharacterized protein n=1 Tax=Streblomastix strix TaxID=222440 RepID=A0A5J4WVA3_9EUKA|nr:MAG: hypothetical protein EZS28_006362 [Streblomastix strix]